MGFCDGGRGEACTEKRSEVKRDKNRTMSCMIGYGKMAVYLTSERIIPRIGIDSNDGVDFSLEKYLREGEGKYFYFSFETNSNFCCKGYDRNNLKSE